MLSKTAELLILGSGTGVPNVKRAQPGYLLRVKDKNILLDSGSGTLQSLIRYSVTYQDIDYIFYSHLHPDHTLDLVSILFAARNPRDPRKKDLVLIGPGGLENFYNRLLSLYGNSVLPVSYRLVFREMNDSEIELDNCKLFTKPLMHTENSIGFRIDTGVGRSLVYSGDTGYCENIILLAKNTSILLLECSQPDGFKVEGHLTPSLAGKIASLGRCKTLLLSHFYPICDKYPILEQCSRHFSGRIILAEDGMRLRL